MKLIDLIKQTGIYHRLLQTEYAKNFYLKRGVILDSEKIENRLNQAPAIILKNPPAKKIKVGIVKDGLVNIEGYAHRNSSWIFYERFLKNNQIDYQFYDIYRNNWLEVARELDIIVWHTNSSPIDMYIAESKIYVLEKVLKKTCFPSFHEVWQYEDKNRSTFLYKALNLPLIETFVSNSKKEASSMISRIKFPIIYKTYIGSSSKGVVKIDNYSQAKKIVNKIFSHKGLRTVYPYFRQKNTVLFQRFISNAEFDLRIMMIGNKAFGYYRYAKKNDFRASGAGIYEKKEIPKEAIKIAIDIKNKLNSRLMGVDLLFCNKSNQYKIIETSLFNQIDTPEQLVINGVAGYYDLSTENFEFKEGKFWIHELVMEYIIENYCGGAEYEVS
ncbi:ATP-grasp domain-containing protein [Capnocytophaga cynodegmi]|uniref:ATP-grasp domain-containing protein n=1 Tax=Capnocytophaga cynodegmi TaxID=28189 RepID=UPI001EE2B308|nr:hypothetical protein [Capnocytophaga cynodegmi]GJQ07339.1 hypothetical protein CAPN010_14970 [Capnocytophaga cynodegmi]